MNKRNYNVKAAFIEGLFTNNPTFVQLLGTCPTLAVTTSVKNGFGMGISAMCVLILSNLLISLLRKFIPKEVRIASYIVIISGFVTAVELLIKAYVPSLDESLGVFIPLIVVNCIILARAEAFASKNGPVASMLDGLFMGIGFTFALTVLGAIREILGEGTFLGIKVLGGNFVPIKFFVTAAGAFVTLGIVIAVVNAVRNIISEKNKEVN